MELMDTSLDKFYKQVVEKGLTIPEDILGKIAVSVGGPHSQQQCRFLSADASFNRVPLRVCTDR